jgi:hypothetical protein
MEELKTYMKYDNVHWPWREVTIDSAPVYAAFSESDVDTKAESEAIEWCHEIAAEEGVRLVEISE